MYKIENALKLKTCSTNVKYKKPNYKNMDYGSDIINEDMSKLHLLPEYCPMTPQTYTDFFHNKKNLPGVSPYKLEKVKHPREGYKYTMEYNNFYTDTNKDALHYTSRNNERIDIDTNTNTPRKPTILTNVNSESINLYKKTKPHHEFARPMLMNGSNKVTDLFDNCMNKKTFEYTRYSQISPHHKQWIDNPIFSGDISKETQHLKNNYMNDMEKDNMDIYSGVFEDMYYLSNETNNNYNYSGYKYYNYLNKIEQDITTQYQTNNFIENDTIQKSKAETIQKLDNKLEDRTILRSKKIKPISKELNNYNSNNNNTKIKPENLNYLGNQLNTQLKNSSNLLSKDVKLL